MRLIELFKLRLVQIALHDADASGNVRRARRLAPIEALLRAEVSAT